jgi:membrane-bound lytic murein transglycosylase MltF
LSFCAVALVLLMALSACGSPEPARDRRPSPAIAPTPAPPVETAPEPAPAKTEIAQWSRPTTGDLDAMQARGLVRILVPVSRTTYYVENGLQHGATFSAGKAFERYLRTGPSGSPALTVVFIPTRADDLVTALNAGRGDIVADLIVAPDRDPPPVATVPALANIRELVVTGAGVPPLVSLEDLEGRQIHVAKNSRHEASLALVNQRLAQIGKKGCTIVTVDPSLTDEDLLARVDEGRIPATVVNSHIFAAWRRAFERLAVNEDVAVSQDAVLAWAVRTDSPRLLAALKSFTTAAPGALFPPGPTRPTSPTRPH